jgi:hypothetical protein
VAVDLSSRREAFVMVMQPAEFRELDYPAPVRRMYGPRTRSIHPQRKMSPPPMVIIEIPRKDPPEMAFVQDDHMIEAVAS